MTIDMVYEAGTRPVLGAVEGETWEDRYYKYIEYFGFPPQPIPKELLGKRPEDIVPTPCEECEES